MCTRPAHSVQRAPRSLAKQNFMSLVNNGTAVGQPKALHLLPVLISGRGGTRGSILLGGSEINRLSAAPPVCPGGAIGWDSLIRGTVT